MQILQLEEKMGKVSKVFRRFFNEVSRVKQMPDQTEL
jgi:hypothetical protein